MDQLRTWLQGGRGRLKALAEACGITHGAISQWSRVPSERVVTVEAVTGIPREKLRPDLYKKRRAA